MDKPAERGVSRRGLLAVSVIPALVPLSNSVASEIGGGGGDDVGHRMGTFSELQNTIVDDAVQFIWTTGYNRPGAGAGFYRRISETLSAILPGSLVTSNGLRFILDSHAQDVTPEHFGAEGDFDRLAKTGTDDSKAISQWFAFCAMAGVPAVINRHYLITENNIFRVEDSSAQSHLLAYVISGGGANVASITFRPKFIEGVTEYFFRDGLMKGTDRTIANPLLGLVVSGITFEIDASEITIGTVGWFRQSGWSVDSNPEQNWQFRGVRFVGDKKNLPRMGAILAIVGTANGSENSFHDCSARHFKHAIFCTNAQAVNHASVACNWELSVGSIFRFVQGGGLTIVGGSIILGNFGANNQEIVESDAINRQRDKYLLEIGGNGKGQINSFLVSGVRLELRDTCSKLLLALGPNVRSIVCFDLLDMQAVSGQARANILIKNAACQVVFSSCSLAPPGGYAEPVSIEFQTGSARYGIYSSVTFRDCILSDALWRDRNWLVGQGDINIINSWAKSTRNSPHFPVIMPDLKVQETNSSRLKRTILQTYVMKAVPSHSSNGWVLVESGDLGLPRGVCITSIHITCRGTSVQDCAAVMSGSGGTLQISLQAQRDQLDGGIVRLMHDMTGDEGIRLIGGAPLNLQMVTIEITYF